MGAGVRVKRRRRGTINGVVVDASAGDEISSNDDDDDCDGDGRVREGKEGLIGRQTSSNRRRKQLQWQEEKEGGGGIIGE
ncbi:unnamed protein product [Brugia pahangi]|uniref:Uncharacterized protein n=1 Tax=Brugia pahangi TaxID=6280 RepID=A0A0N4TVB0_BRUPA|nr:unnamed protein product [Brugia pahangi]